MRANGNLSNCFPGLWIRSLKKHAREKGGKLKFYCVEPEGKHLICTLLVFSSWKRLPVLKPTSRVGSMCITLYSTWDYLSEG